MKYKYKYVRPQTHLVDEIRYLHRQLHHWASLVAQTVKNLPAMQEIWVLSLGQEDPLEKEMATHSTVLAWKTPWTEEPGGLHPWGHKELDTAEQLTLSFFFTPLTLEILVQNQQPEYEDT